MRSDFCLKVLRESESLAQQTNFYGGSRVGLKDDYSESLLEEALIKDLETLLLELGTDFTIWGRQKPCQVGANIVGGASSSKGTPSAAPRSKGPF
jgi:hypothetical protein